MAPSLASGRDRTGREDEDSCGEARGDRKVRARRGGGWGEDGGALAAGAQTLASRRPGSRWWRRSGALGSTRVCRNCGCCWRVPRCGWGRARGLRARGLRGASAAHALPAPQVQAKLENAEVLELTVRRVQGALRGRARGECGSRRRGGGPRAVPPSPFPSSVAECEQLQAEASERFAAGYIQCMHEVHTFVSTCQAIDATVAAELLNHLLESMPLREGSSFRDLLGDALVAPPAAPGCLGWPTGGTPGSPLPSPPGAGDDLGSDMEEAPEAPAEGLDLVPAALGSLTTARRSQSVWRPW